MSIFFRSNPLNTISRIQRGQLDFLKPCEICGGHHAPLTLEFSEPDNRELVLKSIYQGEFPDDMIWTEQALNYGDILWKGVLEGLKQKTLADKKPPSNLNQWLNVQHNNLYKFASAKTFAELLEYKNSAIDPKSGELKTFEEFKAECDKIGRKYKELWLQAEYDAVVNGTIQGTNWLEYQDNKDLFPYLQYKIINDDRTREAHRKLQDIIERIDSPFWVQYLPQNAWRCRCYVIQLSELMARNYGYTKNTDKNMKLAGSVVDKYWRKNTGMTSLFIEKDTAYFEAVPGQGKKQLKATTNYGLKNARDILQNSNLPKAVVGTKENFNTQWDILAGSDGKIKTKCALGFEYVFDGAFKKHIVESRHEDDFPNLLDIIKKPDEVWEGRYAGKYSNDLLRVYYKYYQGNPYVTLIDSNNIPKTIYRLDNESGFEKFREGILIKKN